MKKSPKKIKKTNQKNFYFLLLPFLVIALAILVVNLNNKTTTNSEAAYDDCMAAGGYCASSETCPRTSRLKAKCSTGSVCCRVSSGGGNLCREIICDINKDGLENKADSDFLIGCYQNKTEITCSKVDMECDNDVDIIDIQKFAYKCPQIFQ